jgi:hypothetical protein
MRLNRTSAGSLGENVSAAYEPEAGVIEIVTVEIVDQYPAGARAHEIIEDLVFKIHSDTARHLVGIVPSDNSPARGGIIRLPDPLKSSSIILSMCVFSIATGRCSDIAPPQDN